MVIRQQAIGRSRIALLALVLLGALLVRWWGLDYDLPYIYHPDEPLLIVTSQNMLKTGDLNPQHFYWPSLPIYINLLAYIPYYLVGKLLGVFHTPGDILAPVQLAMGVVHSPMPTTVLLGRLVTVGFGVGNVLLTFLLGRQLTGRSSVGLLAASMVAVSSTNVGHSRWITVDTFATFFVLAAALAAVLVFQQGKTWHYIAAGASVGLAASCKYNAVLAVVLLLAAHFLRHGWRGFKEGKLFLALATSGLAFALTTPFAVLDFAKFSADVRFDSQHYATGHAGMEGDALQWYLGYLWRTTGPICVIAALEVVRGFVSRSKGTMPLSAFSLAYLGFISGHVVRNERTILPMTPILFVLASAWLIHFYGQTARLNSRRVRIASLGVLSILSFVSLGIPAYQTVAHGIRLSTTDSRETARIWIENNLPPGAKIAIESYAPFVDPTRFSVQGFVRLIDHPPEWYTTQGFEYLVFGEGMYGRFYREPDRYRTEVSQYDTFFHQLELIRLFTDGGYEVRIHRVPE